MSTLTSGSRPSAVVREVFRKLAARGYSVRRSVATAALVACSVPAMASPLATLSTDSFDTLDAAALAAEAAAMPLSDHFEYGGVLIERAGRYYYTLPVTSGSNKELALRFSLPGDVKLAASFHTHPKYGDCDNYFSPTDVDAATRMRLPSYIGALIDGSIHRFVPGRTRTVSRAASMGCVGGSAGESVS
jgi:hypothetical protein